MNIIIAGDYLPTYENEYLFEQNKVQELFGDEIIDLFLKSDLSIANLEGPFIDSGIPIKKSGVNLKASVKSFTGYKSLKLNYVSIANNHIMDYGERGLDSTIKLLKKANINYFGGGYNLSEAKKPIIFEHEGHKIGLYSCAEYEFTIATDIFSGANPFDPLVVLDDIAELKENSDYVIVLYHGGKEYYRYPAPYLQQRCRKMIEKGADLVLCQHSHCIGCEEKFLNGTILYGQGNFMFNRGSNEYRNSGLLLQVSIPSKKIEYIPIEKIQNTVRIATSEKKERILKEFWDRSEKIKQEDFVESEYMKFAKSMLENYDAYSLGIIGRVLSKLHLRKTYKVLTKCNDLHMINALRCEAHRDLYIYGILGRLKDNGIQIIND